MREPWRDGRPTTVPLIRTRVRRHPGPAPIIIPEVFEARRFHVTVVAGHINPAGETLLRVELPRSPARNKTNVARDGDPANFTIEPISVITVIKISPGRIVGARPRIEPI